MENFTTTFASPLPAGRQPKTRTMLPDVPLDAAGKPVPRACPVCGNGTLQPQGGGFWDCDGLIDPPRPDMELQGCPFVHESGTAYAPPTLAL